MGAEGQTARPDSLLSPLVHPPSYATGDLAFPSDKAGPNDGRVWIHNYATLLLSGCLAAQQNNSPPLRLRRGVRSHGSFRDPRLTLLLRTDPRAKTNTPRLAAIGFAADLAGTLPRRSRRGQREGNAI